MSNGGNKYGNADLPCELGSGAEGPNHSFNNVVGGGMIGKNLYNSHFLGPRKNLHLCFGCIDITELISEINVN